MDNNDFFSNIPLPILGLVLSLIGLLFLLAGIFKWSWLSKGRSGKQARIYARFGQNGIWWTYRIGGVIVIVGGIVLALLNL